MRDTPVRPPCGPGVQPAGPRQDQEYGDRNGDRAPEDRPGGEALPGTVHLVALPLEHFQHAVRDQEAAYDVRRRARDRNGAEDRAEGTVVGASHHERSDEGNARDRVGGRHEGGVQQGRNPGDDVIPEEAGEQEDVQADLQIGGHGSRSP